MTDDQLRPMTYLAAADLGEVSVSLTPREREVLDHARQGHTVRETATRMGCSPRTVKTWRESILRKLDVPNMTAAADRVPREPAA